MRRAVCSVQHNSVAVRDFSRQYINGGAGCGRARVSRPAAFAPGHEWPGHACRMRRITEWVESTNAGRFIDVHDSNNGAVFARVIDGKRTACATALRASEAVARRIPRPIESRCESLQSNAARISDGSDGWRCRQQGRHDSCHRGRGGRIQNVTALRPRVHRTATS